MYMFLKKNYAIMDIKSKNDNMTMQNIFFT